MTAERKADLLAAIEKARRPLNRDARAEGLNPILDMLVERITELAGLFGAVATGVEDLLGEIDTETPSRALALGGIAKKGN